MNVPLLPATVNWFVCLAALSLVGLSVGMHVGRGPRWRARLWLVLAATFMVWWVVLIKHPAAAVRVLPVEWLSRVEGVGAVPAYMLLCGLVWGLARLPRQRRLALWGAVLGTVFLINGGMWMLQSPPPAESFDEAHRRVVLQSQDYSCVPAASATALTRMGLPVDEATMARLTQTRAGTGSTLLRAMAGLRQRLEGTDRRVALVAPSYEELQRLPMPALTPLQFQASRRHMVTVLRVEPRGVRMVDPMQGEIFMPREEFVRAYRREVLIFEPIGSIRPHRFADSTPPAVVAVQTPADASH